MQCQHCRKFFLLILLTLVLVIPFFESSLSAHASTIPQKSPTTSPSVISIHKWVAPGHTHPSARSTFILPLTSCTSIMIASARSSFSDGKVLYANLYGYYLGNGNGSFCGKMYSYAEIVTPAHKSGGSGFVTTFSNYFNYARNDFNYPTGGLSGYDIGWYGPTLNMTSGMAQASLNAFSTDVQTNYVYA